MLSGKRTLAGSEDVDSRFVANHRVHEVLSSFWYMPLELIRETTIFLGLLVRSGYRETYI